MKGMGKTAARIILVLALVLSGIFSSTTVVGAGPVNEINVDVQAGYNRIAPAGGGSIDNRGFTATIVSYPFFDDMESGTGNWTADSPWALTEEYAHSANHSWTDSLGGTTYENNVNIALETRINLSTAAMPVLTFWHKYALEVNKDYGYIDVSTNLGASWETIYFVTGYQSDWKEEKIDLTEYALVEDVRIRFRLKTDAQNRYDGWYIDDVSIAETVVTIPYPFSDDMEAGETNWLSSSWELVTPGHSGDFSWTESPAGNNPANNSASLTLASTIDLSDADHPQLTFWQHRSYLYNVQVEISDNYGRSGTYTALASYGRSQQDNWVQSQVDLSNYTGLSNVRIRFHIWNSSGDGWYIDDVRIDDAPQDVTLDLLGNVTMHGADLGWSQYTDPDFGRYKVYRDTTPEVGRFSTLVFTTTNSTITSYHDTYAILEPNYYHYRVYVVDNLGMYTTGSNVRKATYTIPQVSYPFFDDMESGTANWEWGSPWALTEESAHSANHSWTDSPGGASYGNNVNTALQTRINLSTAAMPVLTFWHKYALEVNKDYGYIDVSTNLGASWKTIYFVTGYQSDWKEEKIDLTEYALVEDVRIRFRLKTDAQNRYDGWYIDDVSINETTATIPYPFSDDMEAGEGNWLSSSWKLVTPGHSGDFSWTESPAGNNPANNSASLTLASTIDLSTANHPQLTFWQHRSSLRNVQVEISDNYGRSGTYTTLASYRYSQQDNWVQSQVDLSNYAGLSNVRIRFHIWDSSGDGWYIDDVRIDDAPVDVTLEPLSNVTMHGADLSWSQYTDPDFGRYKVYRATTPEVALSSTLVFTATDPAITSYHDTYSILEPNYYHYRVYVVDDLGMYSVGSNVRKATYVIPQVSYPFSDDMESGTANWEWGSPWTLTEESAHSANHSWTDSPGGASYGNNVNTALETRINLSTAAMPVLTFWHKYALEVNKDYGYIDVSTNLGASWEIIYFVTGYQSDWKEEKIDLTEYALVEDVRIRFRLKTDAQNRSDGWYIDDVSIAETTATISYPFSDDMETGETNWLSSSWKLVTPGHSGDFSWTESPAGNNPANNSASLTLASTIDLSTANYPQLTFWQHRSYLRNVQVEISDNYGRSGTYTALASYRYSQQDNWVQSQVDLSNYAGLSNVRIRFHIWDSSGDGWYIDDVRIDDADETPPAAITNLTTSNPTSTSITLGWTAPGDDGNVGTADQYGIRYLEGTPITEGNWSSASQYTDELAPQVAGSTETFTVTGLSSNMTYYFAIKTADEIPNWSAISNSPSGTTTTGIATVTINAPSQVSENGTFIATIDINQVENFNVANYEVSFAPAVLRLDNVTSGGIGGIIIPVDTWDEISAGTFTIVQDIPDMPGVSGSGYLATLHFYVIGSLGDNSTINLSNGTLKNALAQEIPATWVGDSVNVISAAEGVIVSINAPLRAVLGGNFTATVDISGVVDLNGAQYDISFDPSVLAVDNVTHGQIDSTEITVQGFTEINPGTYRIAQALLNPPYTANGTGYLAVLHFHVIGSLSDRSEINLSNGTLSGWETEIPATWIRGFVKVSIIPGDANDDGVVNILDLTKVVRMILVIDPETLGADANLDDNVNVSDLTQIVKIILMLD